MDKGEIRFHNCVSEIGIYGTNNKTLMIQNIKDLLLNLLRKLKSVISRVEMRIQNNIGLVRNNAT